MSIAILTTALRVVGVVRTVSSLLELAVGPSPTVTPKGITHLPILPQHHAYIIEQYKDTIRWNRSHQRHLRITFGELANGLNRELGLNYDWKAYQKVWSGSLDPSHGVKNERP